MLTSDFKITNMVYKGFSALLSFHNVNENGYYLVSGFV